MIIIPSRVSFAYCWVWYDGAMMFFLGMAARLRYVLRIHVFGTKLRVCPTRVAGGLCEVRYAHHLVQHTSNTRNSLMVTLFVVCDVVPVHVAGVFSDFLLCFPGDYVMIIPIVAVFLVRLGGEVCSCFACHSRKTLHHAPPSGGCFVRAGAIGDGQARLSSLPNLGQNIFLYPMDRPQPSLG